MALSLKYRLCFSCNSTCNSKFWQCFRLNYVFQQRNARSGRCQPKPQKTKKTPVYPSPPNSPSEAKPNILKATEELDNEANSSRTASLPFIPSTSPLCNKSDLMSREKEPLKNINQKYALDLKYRLGLENWQCGCLIQKKGPCTLPIPKENKDRINSQLDSMRTLTLSFSKLASELDKLVMLVHCHHHDHGYPKESRIDAWTTAFPVRNDNTKRIVSLRYQIKKTLGQISIQCIGTTTKNKRCKSRIGGQKVQNCRRTINEIVKPEVYLDDGYLDVLLKGLETNMYCHVHMNEEPLKIVASWKSNIIEIRNEVGSDLLQSIESNVSAARKSNSICTQSRY